MSLTRTVPAAVPSDFQSSVPVVGVVAVKYTMLPTWQRLLGSRLTQQHRIDVGHKLRGKRQQPALLQRFNRQPAAAGDGLTMGRIAKPRPTGATGTSHGDGLLSDRFRWVFKP